MSALDKLLEGESGASELEAEKLRQLEEFFKIDENLKMKTELRRKDIDRIRDTNMMDKFMNDTWGVDLNLTAENTEEMAMLVSHRREGRKEGMSVLKQNIELVKEAGRLEKALGV